MKKILSVTLVLILLLSLLSACGVKVSKGPLELQLKRNGKYEVTDCAEDATQADIPASYHGKAVTSIGKSAFKDCASLESVTIPDSVTSIGNGAFYGCTSLKSITIPASVSSIGGDAFYKCTSLESITIPDGVSSISDLAFVDCKSLTSITIPQSVTHIGDFAFSGCQRLTSILYGGTMAEWQAIEKENKWNQYMPKYTVICTDGELMQ